MHDPAPSRPPRPLPEPPLWQPDPATAKQTRMAQFMAETGHADYAALWRWSVEQPEAFWPRLWQFCGALGHMGNTVLEDGERMPCARWFPQARVNYAENLLQNHSASSDALVFRGEDKVHRRWSHARLRAEVALSAPSARLRGRPGRPGCRLPAQSAGNTGGHARHHGAGRHLRVLRLAGLRRPGRTRPF